MLVGHVAVGMLAKRFEPRLSLASVVFAALLADLLWGALLAAGVEHVEPVPGAALNRILGRDIAWSHSLAMLALWGALVAAAYYWRKRTPRGAWILFAAVLSHWVLDVVTHRPDMPLAPHLPWKLGLGAWNSFPAALVVEGGLWLAAIVVYVRAFRRRTRAATIGLWTGILLLTLTWRRNIEAGVDPDALRAGLGALIFFSLVVAWAWWLDPPADPATRAASMADSNPAGTAPAPIRRSTPPAC